MEPEKQSKINKEITNKIDIHCHLFDKEYVLPYLFTLVLQSIFKIKKFRKDFKGKIGVEKFKEEANKKLVGFGNLIRVILEGNIYQKINREYKAALGEKLIIVPLMMDVFYCFNDEDLEKTRIFGWVINLFKDLIKKFKKSIDEIIQFAETVWESANEIAELKDNLNKLYEYIDKNYIDILQDPDGFMKQLEKLKTLKEENEVYIYPFLAVDPRRPDIKKIINEYIVEKKIFKGVKLYTPNGYSPTHPVLFGENGVYDECLNNNIPITAHCSNTGFATFQREIKNINGHVCVYDKKLKKEKVIYAQNLTYKFKKKMYCDKAVKERSNFFNHPMLWEKVLEGRDQKFKKLRLNLAHFGGDYDGWRDFIKDLIVSEKYPNLYTDLSCRTETNTLEKIEAIIADNEALKKKILFGSDYYMCLPYCKDLKEFTENFNSTVFNKLSFYDIAVKNNNHFLFG